MKVQYLGVLLAGLLITGNLHAEENQAAESVVLDSMVLKSQILPVPAAETSVKEESQQDDDLIYDFFTGTLHLAVNAGQASEQDDQPMQLQLNRCDLAQNQYWLIDNKDQIIQQFMQRYHKELKTAADAGHKIQATVIGAYEEKDGENYLVVKSIEEVALDTSCHLMDMLQ